MIRVHETTASLQAAMQRLNIRNAAAIQVDNTARADDFTAWNEEYLQIFEAPYPCRTTVTAPPVFGLVEVELIAALEPRR